MPSGQADTIVTGGGGSTMVETWAAKAVGQLGSRYTLERVVGRGATGEVWLAHDTDGEPVAVKVLRPDCVDDPDVVARFVRERNVVRSVKSPHVVTVRDLVVEGNTLAIVMEYLPRADLRTFLRDNGGVLAPATAVALTGQVLDALDAVHAAGVVHRDVKPENVLVDVDADGSPVAKLSDFGVSRLLEGATLTRLTGVIGTPRYMAPELGTGADPSAAADLYAVGIVLYELLTGRVPFSADHPVAMLRAHVEQPVPKPDGIDPRLWKILSKLLAKNPSARYTTAASAMHDLAAVAPRLEGMRALTDPRAEHTLYPSPERAAARVVHWQHPRLMLSTATFAVVAMVVALFAVLPGGTHDTGERAWIDTYKETGYAVTRDWQLTGKHGDVFSATEKVMPIDHPLGRDAVYTLVVPKSLAKHAADVRIDGASVVQGDPVLAVPLGALPLDSARVVSYTVHVAPKGRHASRLDRWNRDLLAARKAFTHEATSYKGPREVPKTTSSTPDAPVAEQHAAAVAAFTGRAPTTKDSSRPMIIVVGPGPDGPAPSGPSGPSGATGPGTLPQPITVVSLSVDQPNIETNAQASATITLIGQTNDRAAAPSALLAQSVVTVHDPSIASVGPPAANGPTSVTYAIHALLPGATTMSFANGTGVVSVAVKVDDVPPQPPTNPTAAWDPTCTGPCTLTISFTASVPGSFPIAGYHLTMPGLAGNVTADQTSIVLTMDASGNVIGPVSGHVDPTTLPHQLQISAFDTSNYGSASTPVTIPVPPSLQTQTTQASVDPGTTPST
ncbi:MAG TPA: protein kinase [Acidimicrobiia bacterium]|nr:protein kinase [Acidimicrobiia bacterium]